eukprot:g1295.t1
MSSSVNFHQFHRQFTGESTESTSTTLTVRLARSGSEEADVDGMRTSEDYSGYLEDEWTTEMNSLSFYCKPLLNLQTFYELESSCVVTSSWDVVHQKKTQNQCRKLPFLKVKTPSSAVVGLFENFAVFTGIELVRHPTLGEGVPSRNVESESRPVINTSKMEVDKLSGNTFVNQYLIIKDVGDGAFGKVKLVLNMEDNCLYALKMVSKLQAKRGQLRGKGMKREASNNALLAEINVMKSLQHPNVVRLYEVIDDPTSDKLLMVLEYVDGGEVMRSDMMGPSKTGFSEEVARRHFRDLVKGLEFLHYRNIIHRDIKPGNLLLTQEGRVKLSDFGSAYYFPDGNDYVTDSAGTRLFFAPEACGQGRPYSGKKADIYAAGVVLYIMIFARPPFEHPNDYELLQKIREEEPDFASRTGISAELVDLLEQLLCKDPENRPSLVDVMQHPWFTNRGSLLEIKSSRFIILPTDVRPRSVTNDAGITPSITGILRQIPNKKQKRYKPGEYLVREGQHVNGWQLITKGYCEATSTEWDNEMDSGIGIGDLDFSEEDDDNNSSPNNVAPEAGRKLRTVYSSSDDTHRTPLVAESDSHKLSPDALPRFQSLQQDDILKGVERRATEKHGHIRNIVETAFKDHCATKTNKLRISENGRPKGPGSVIGLDLKMDSMKSHQSVVALEEVETVFVEKSALEEILSRPENQLQIRLFVARLNRIEIMRNVVQNLASLHSDVVSLEKLRSMFRDRSKNQTASEIHEGGDTFST